MQVRALTVAAIILVAAGLGSAVWFAVAQASWTATRSAQGVVNSCCPASPTPAPTPTPVGPDLTVTTELKPGQPLPQPGGTLAYIIKVKNIGAAATPAGIDVQLRDYLPAGSSLVYWTANSGICASSPPNVDCSRGRMAPGEEWWVEIRIKVPWRACSLVNKVTVDPFGRIKETNEANNTASLATFVGGDPCIS